MKIAQKLGLLVGALLVAMTLQIIVLTFQNVQSGAGYDRVLNNQVTQSAAIQKVQVQIGQAEAAFHNLLLLNPKSIKNDSPTVAAAALDGSQASKTILSTVQDQ